MDTDIKNIEKEVAANAAPSDLRTLAVKYDDDGTRFREYRDAAALMSETSYGDWPVEGPRTAKWILREVARQGQTPNRRHHW